MHKQAFEQSLFVWIAIEDLIFDKRQVAKKVLSSVRALHFRTVPGLPVDSVVLALPCYEEIITKVEPSNMTDR